MNNLLGNRWSERNRVLAELILASQNEMNERGILQSSIAVQSLHEVFRREFQSSRETIITSVIDSLKGGNLKLERQQIESCAIEKLAERRDFLDSLFRERRSVSIRGPQNQEMIEPYLNIAQFYDHSCQELIVELDNALNEYERSFGATLTDRLLNQFKNHPIVAYGIVTVVILLAVFETVSAIKQVGS